MNAVPKKSTLGKFAYFRHFQRIGINSKKFEKTPIHFKSDVFAAVAVVDAKTPYYLDTVARFVHQAVLTRNEGTTDESKKVSDENVSSLFMRRFRRGQLSWHIKLPNIYERRDRCKREYLL